MFCKTLLKLLSHTFCSSIFDEIMNPPQLVVHVIPADHDVESSCNDISLESSFVQKDSKISQDRLHRIEQAIKVLKSSRNIICTSTSDVLKYEASNVNRRLLDYHQQAQKRPSTSSLTKLQNAENSIAGTQNRKKQRTLYESKSYPVSEKQSVSLCHGCSHSNITQNDSSASSSSTCDTTIDMEQGCKTLASDVAFTCPANSSTSDRSVDDDNREKVTEIWNQAHRMKRMSILLRVLEKNQRMLMIEMSDLLMSEKQTCRGIKL
jgi:hypothetical protein